MKILKSICRETFRDVYYFSLFFTIFGFGKKNSPYFPFHNVGRSGTLTVHCQREDETVRERTGHPPSYAEAKKMKSLTLHTHGCLRVSLKYCSSSSRCF